MFFKDKNSNQFSEQILFYKTEDFVVTADPDM